ncbi:MAG: tripartite tricarboxylate transporter substrate-binding protein [Pusillimonas sp.]
MQANRSNYSHAGRAAASRCARWFRCALVSATLALGATSALAYPDKPITLVVPFAPGGSSDTIARTISPMLGDVLGQSIVIENLSGAGGVLGTQKAVRSSADGYTILLGSGSEILINKLINPKIAYDGLTDLSPVVFVGTGPMVLVGRPDLPADSISDLLALARKERGALNFASAGNGTPMHVAGELLNMKADISMAHVPYRGAAPALVDLMGGQVDVSVSTLTAAKPHITSGKIKAFGVTSATPSELAPDLPALGQNPELEGFDLGVWFGLFVPQGTPDDIQQKIQAAAQQVLQDSGIRERLAQQGVSASGESADVLRDFMAQEVEKYRAVVETAKISVE